MASKPSSTTDLHAGTRQPEAAVVPSRRGARTPVGSSRAGGWLATGVVVVLWALVSAWIMPRGPVSTGESVACLVTGVIVGGLAGFLTRSRWSILAAPLLFMVGYELARLGVDGPSVDAPQLSTYGIFALVTGRGFHAVVALFPMAVGAAVTAAWRRRSTDAQQARTGWGTRLGRWLGTLTRAVAVVMLLALGVVVARPSSTAPIPGPDGEPVPGSVAELTHVDVNGRDLGLLIRGRDSRNPVLLFLAGGPGGSELGAMRRHLTQLESHFTVATWDQRGTGRSYGELDPTDSLTADSSVADTLAITDHLRRRFGQDRIYLCGQSWGSVLGVLAAQQAPQRYAAFIGVGQMVSFIATDRIFYDDKLAWADRTGQQDLAATLRRIGPPPYEDYRNYETVLSQELEVHPYDHSRNSEGQEQMAGNLLVPEYSLTEQVRLLSATMDTLAALYPKVQQVDLRKSVTRLEIPAFFVQGAHEAPGRARVFAEWLPTLTAPVKKSVVLSTSGHRPMFEQPAEFVAFMADVVVPSATGSPTAPSTTNPPRGGTP